MARGEFTVDEIDHARAVVIEMFEALEVPRQVAFIERAHDVMMLLRTAKIDLARRGGRRPKEAAG